MANTTAHFKFANDLGNTLVQIIAGTSNTPYTVHKSLLFAQCGQLESKLKGGAEENLKLWLDADPSTVALLVGFLYKNQVPVFDEDESKSEEPSYVQSRVTKPLIPIPPPSQDFKDIFDEFKMAPRDVIDLPPFMREETKEDEERLLKHRKLDKLRWNRKFIHVKGPNSITQPDPNPIQADDNINHYQTTLIHLCLLAEKIRWPDLFRAAIIAYLTGESLIRRSIPIDIVILIYEKSVGGSKLRDMVLDGFSFGNEKVDMDLSLYMEYAKENGDFMNDVFGKLKGKGKKDEFEFESVLEAAEVGEYDLVVVVEEEEEDEEGMEVIDVSGVNGTGGD